MTLEDKFRSVPVDFERTSVEKVSYWLTRFIMEVMGSDGKSYQVSLSYGILTGLLRHFRNDLNRHDLHILSKDDVHFQSFRKA